MIMKSFRYIVVMVLAVFFAGCSVTTPATKEYRLEPKIVLPKGLNFHRHSVKLIPVVGKNYLRSNAMHYVVEPFEEGDFVESAWSQPPADMLFNQLFLSLNDARIYEGVYSYESIGKSDWNLEVRLDDFVQIFEKNKQSSYVKIDLTLTLYDKNRRKTIASKRFIQKELVDSNNAKGGVVALNKALEKTIKKSISWLLVQH